MYKNNPEWRLFLLSPWFEKTYNGGLNGYELIYERLVKKGIHADLALETKAEIQWMVLENLSNQLEFIRLIAREINDELWGVLFRSKPMAFF